jgi:hypothetical protein
MKCAVLPARDSHVIRSQESVGATQAVFLRAYAEPSIASRALSIAMLCLFALLIGALGLAAMQLVRRGQP